MGESWDEVDQLEILIEIEAVFPVLVITDKIMLQLMLVEVGSVRGVHDCLSSRRQTEL